MFQPVKAGGSPYPWKYGVPSDVTNCNITRVLKEQILETTSFRLVLSTWKIRQGVPFLPEPLKGVKIPAELQENSSLRKNVEPGRNEIDLEISTAN